MLDWHVAQHPDRLHATVLQDDSTVIATLSYAELAKAAKAVAAGLIARDVEPGDRIALMLPTGADFFAAFFGVLYAGAVPVPIYPPMQLTQIEEYARRQAGILRNAGARILITVPEGLRLGSLLRSLVTTIDSVESVASLSQSSGHGSAAEHSGFRGHGADPIHVGQHRRSEGRGSEPRQFARQHPGDRAGDRRQFGRCHGELAAALSRHGPDRRMARRAVLRRPVLCHVAGRLPGAPAELAVGDPSIPRHDFRGAQLRV